MKSNSFFIPRCVAIVAQVVLLGAVGLTTRLALADDAAATDKPAVAANDEADAAWKVVHRATQAPMPPEEWKTNQPTHEELAKFYSTKLLKGADDARDFYTKYPKHPKAAEARRIEYDLLSIDANRFGDTSQTARLDALTTLRLADSNLSEDERLELRLAALKPLMNGLPDTMDELLKKVRAVHADFPKRDEIYQVMVSILMQSEGDQAKALAQEIMASSAPTEIKERAQGILKRMDAVGKPVNIQYTAFDGREVDIAKLKGKVVLVDFWATWCAPCMGELPNVKAAYAKLHPQGFEIVGISFDQDKAALDKTLKEKEMTWPQYFDGQGWQNKYASEFGINSIPTMWLVDKKGILRDVDGRDGLADKVAKLLAE